jgi:type I restriction enzyme S subunit
LTKNPSRKNYHLKLPYLRVANVYANELRLDDIVRIGVKRDELDKLLLEKGDLLIVEGNGSKDQIGRLAIWDGSIERCVHQNHIIKVRLVDKSIGNWVLTWFLSPTGREHIEKVASSTTGLYTLSISKVSNLPVPLPSAPEQKEAGRQIGRRLSAADRLSAKLIQQSSAAKQMKKAVLQEAFAGDLIPQDANDEPAVVLLNRIQSNIDAEIQKSKVTRMKRKTKSTAKRRPLLDVLREQKKPMTPKQLFIISGYQKEFEDNEYDQQVVEGFYEELRHLVGPDGPIEELRPNRSRVLLGTKQ